jgi:hypothetical protein
MNFIFYGWKMDIVRQSSFMNNKLNELFKKIMIKFLINALGSTYEPLNDIWNGLDGINYMDETTSIELDSTCME